jgi:hypothetical protein
MLISGPGSDKENAPRHAHLTVLKPGAQSLLDGGERSRACVLVCVLKCTRKPDQLEGGGGEVGYAFFADYDLIGAA